MIKAIFSKAKQVATGVAVTTVVVMAPAAHATGTGTTAPDLSALTNAVDFSTTITALMAIAGMLASVYISIKGAKIVLGMIRGR